MTSRKAEPTSEEVAAKLAKACDALLKAAKDDKPRKIEESLAKGADIDHANAKGQTAAHIAAAFGCLKALRLLADRGADFGALTRQGIGPCSLMTPLQVARHLEENAAANLIEGLLAARQHSSDAGVNIVEISDPPHSGPPASCPEPAAPMDLSAFVEATTEEIVKPAIDGRAYRHVRLVNGLQLMLISDPKTERAAAAMDVGVGSSAEPPHLPGLAHFLEHMLFLGR